MPTAVGVDYGSRMLKAAACEGSACAPRTLNLAGFDPFLPAAVDVGVPPGYGRSGAPWAAFRQRRARGYAVTTGFRDRLERADSTLVVGGRTYTGVKVQSELLIHLRRSIRSAAPDVQLLALAGHEPEPSYAWSLGLALRRARWWPTVLVPEWAAASAVAEVPQRKPVVFLSLGYSAARATVCRWDGDGWRRKAAQCCRAFSGESLRGRLVDQLADDVIRAVRRDPREDPAADQVLHDAVEAALLRLTREPAGSIDATLFGRGFCSPIARESLAELVADYRPLLGELIAAGLDRAGADGSSATVVAWGELALLLPVGRWLGSAPSIGLEVQILPLDALAAGAARLCYEAPGPDEGWARGEVGLVCTRCGRYTPAATAPRCPDCGADALVFWERPRCTRPAAG